MDSKDQQLQNLNLQLNKEIALRKKAESEAKEGKKKFSHLVELMNEGLVILDMEDNILYANQHFIKLLRAQRSEVVNHSITDFVNKENVEEFKKHLHSNLGSSFQSVMLRKRNQPFWIKYAPQPLYDIEKNQTGSFAIITDINDQVIAKDKLLRTEIKLRALARQVLHAQEIERKRIASELHDGISQSLSAVKFYVENNMRELESCSCAGLEQFKTVIPKLQSVIEEVRTISMALRPSLLDDIGILATLSWFCRESQLSNPKITFEFSAVNVVEADVSHDLKTEIFRIVQEAVNNANKYSAASKIKITVNRHEGYLTLSIIDNGIGFDYMNIVNQQGYRESKGMGLVSMKERAENSGGVFTVESDSINGSKLIFDWKDQSQDLLQDRRRASDRRKARRD